MFRSWKLGTAFGIGIYVHWAFLLLLAYVFFSNLGSGHVHMALFLVSLVVAIFGCVVLHELGHALMARRFGIATRDITLYPIGGVARLERMSERPWEEFWIALAGPAVNVVIATLLAGFLGLEGAYLQGSGLMEALEQGNFLAALMGANIVLVLFNLLPAFPSDGGRVLRALLAHPLGQVRATELAVRVGTVMAAVLFFWGFWQAGPMLMLVAVFLFFAGQQELAAVRYRAAARRNAPLDALPVTDGTFTPRAVPAEPGFSGFTWDSHTHLWIEWRNGLPVHTISVD
jgi:Zn-dependent protease